MSASSSRNITFDIVIYLTGTGSWEQFHRRPMIEALAHNAQGTARIVCVNQPVSPPVDVVFHRQRFLQWLRAPGLRQVSPNLFVYSPLAWLHTRLAQRIGARKTYEDMLSGQIRAVLTRLSFSREKRVCWLYRPEQVACLGWAQETHTVYECYDEYREQPDKDSREQVLHNEQVVLNHADIVFVTARSLYESRSPLHSSVHYAPNGVDYELFSIARRSTTRVAEDLASIPEPRVGYVGNVSDQLDIALMLQVAVAHPHWSIVLIGPLDPSLNPKERSTNGATFATLRRLKNVHVLGTRPHHQLPNYLRGMNATLIPYSLNPYAHNRNPLKLWEYLAAGKVVVSTALEQISELQDIVYIARTPDEFISSLEQALASDNSERVRQGDALAKEHSWSVLTRRMLDILCVHMN